MKPSPFIQLRIKRFAIQFREKQGQLPTLKNFAEAGFSKQDIAAAVKAKSLSEFYVTLTNGAIVKGYKAME